MKPKKTTRKSKRTAPAAPSSSWTDSDIRRLARAEWSRAKWSELHLDPSNPDDIARAVSMIGEGIRWLCAASPAARDEAAAHLDQWPVMASPTNAPKPPPSLGKKSDSPFLTKGRKAPNYGGTPANRIVTAGMIAVERLRPLEALAARISPEQPEATLPPLFSKRTARDAARWIMGILDDYQQPEEELKKILVEAKGWTPRKAKALASALEKIGKKRTEGRFDPEKRGEKRDGYRERFVEALRRLTP